MRRESSSIAATLLLLFYRQQQFVGDAVAAALAQDHPDLQIIFSDDCSPDSTYDRLQRAVAGYGGPHRLIVRQTPRNLGLVPHLYDAASVADGKLIVVGAGDDLPYPHRVSRLISAWRETGADALCSGWDVIDEDGDIIERGCAGGRTDLRFDKLFPGQRFTQIIGATAAYAPDVFTLVPLPAVPVYAEDLYLSLMLHWRGRLIVDVAEPLIAYRQHGAALTHIGTQRQSVEQQERGVEQAMGGMAVVLEAVERMTAGPAPDDEWGPPAGIDRRALSEDAAFARFRSGWIGAGLAGRLRALAHFRDPAHGRWLLPRLFGLGPLRAIKALLR